MPHLLDLFCGAGGAAVGYYLAGFQVTGVDVKPQPHYPFRFIQADAMTFPLEGYDAFHASPPCQLFSPLVNCHPSLNWQEKYADLIEPTRRLLQATGLPYIIENVIGAPLEGLVLCGTMFPGVRVYRHRRFESNVLLLQPPHQKHRYRVARYAQGSAAEWASVTGHMGSARSFRDAMGIPHHMTRDEAAEAIPPAFTEFLGRQLIRYL